MDPVPGPITELPLTPQSDSIETSILCPSSVSRSLYALRLPSVILVAKAAGPVFANCLFFHRQTHVVSPAAAMAAASFPTRSATSAFEGVELVDKDQDCLRANRPRGQEGYMVRLRSDCV